MTEQPDALRAFWSLAVADVMPGRQVVDVAPLRGGNYARASVITLDGPPHALVGRRLPARSLTSVATVNQLLERCRRGGLPAPVPIWSRGTPGIRVQSQLLTWIDASTTPPDWPVEVTRLADAVVRIRTIDTSGLDLPVFPRLPSPGWQARIRRSTVGGAALDRLLSLAPPALEGGLVHGDLCKANLLWHEDELVGVIDWDRSSLGPPGVDIAMLWTDLLVRHGLEVAEHFLHRVHAKEPQLDGDQYWRLRMVASFFGEEIDRTTAARLADGFEHLS